MNKSHRGTIMVISEAKMNKLKTTMSHFKFTSVKSRLALKKSNQHTNKQLNNIYLFIYLNHYPFADILSIIVRAIVNTEQN